MPKYRVYGQTQVTVMVEVSATSEAEAYEIAGSRRSELILYAGCSGNMRAVAVADGVIGYDYVEALDDE